MPVVHTGEVDLDGDDVRGIAVHIGARLSLRHDSRLHHIKVGRRHAGTRVLMLVGGLDVRIVSEDGELLWELVLDPTKDYQPMGSTWNDVRGHV